MPIHEPKANRAPRILLVDDDVDFLEVNRLALEQAGFNVVTAESLAEALRRAIEGPVDLAVLDLVMSTPDEGFQLARQLRRDERTRHIPLVMLTSVNTDHRAKGLFTFSDRDRDPTWLPVERVLEKPLPPGRLIPIITELLSGGEP